MSAALLGSGIGLGLGAIYLAAGMAGHAADYAEARRMAEAAQSGYAGSRLDSGARGLGAGLQRYGGREAADARPAQIRFGALTFDKDQRGAPMPKKRSDLECLTQAVYYEARGESPHGQFAVAQVVMNRVKHRAFPKSVCAVVYQGAGRRGCQFSFACDGSMRGRRESEAWARARRVATRALAGAALADIGSATHFHTTGVSPIWAPQMARVAQVGTHIFYRFSPRKLRNAPALPGVEQAVLTAGPAGELPTLTVSPTMEKAIDASLETGPRVPTPPSDAKPATPQPPAQPAAPPAEAARLTADPAAVATGA